MVYPLLFLALKKIKNLRLIFYPGANIFYTTPLPFNFLFFYFMYSLTVDDSVI